ncbi:hypothetical protein BDW69DRAFT_189632 [Aspergillus filifer]
MFNAVYRYVERRWKSLVTTISRYIGSIHYATSRHRSDIERPAITLDDGLLLLIKQFERCVQEGESAILGPSIDLLVTYNNEEKGIVQCPQSFFKRSETVREKLRDVLTTKQWNHMDKPISNYRIPGIIQEDKGDLGWTAVSKALIEAREDFFRLTNSQAQSQVGGIAEPECSE